MRSDSIKYVLLGLCVLCMTGCSMGGQQMNEMKARAEAELAVITMINAVDTKQWALARQQMSDEVNVDYSDLTGQPAADVKAAALVSGWKSMLSAIVTHHMVSNFNVKIMGDTAHVYSHLYARHEAEGVKPWDVYGRYFYKLTKTEDGWKITHMTLWMHGQRGNMKFFEEVQ